MGAVGMGAVVVGALAMGSVGMGTVAVGTVAVGAIANGTVAVGAVSGRALGFGADCRRAVGVGAVGRGAAGASAASRYVEGALGRGGGGDLGRGGEGDLGRGGRGDLGRGGRGDLGWGSGAVFGGAALGESAFSRYALGRGGGSDLGRGGAGAPDVCATGSESTTSACGSSSCSRGRRGGIGDGAASRKCVTSSAARPREVGEQELSASPWRGVHCEATRSSADPAGICVAERGAVASPAIVGTTT